MGIIFKKDYNLNLDILNKCIKDGKILNSRLGLMLKCLARSINSDCMFVERLDEHDDFFVPNNETEQILWENLRTSAKIQINGILKNRANGQMGGRPKKVVPEKEENKYFEIFVEWWNDKFLNNQYNTEDNITKISVISPKRKVAFKSRWGDTKVFMTKNKGLKPESEVEIYDFIRKNVIAYNYINSDFLQGKVKGYNRNRGYEFSFDSIFAAGMWTKLLENKFINKE